MTFRLIEASLTHSAELARVHAEALPDDFLPSLGHSYLELEYYPRALRSPHAKTYIGTDDGREVFGFVTIAHDAEAFMRDMTRGRILVLAWYAIRRALTDPFHLLKSASVLFASREHRYPQWPGEIVIVAVAGGRRGKGYGHRLIETALAYLVRCGVRHCRTKTLASNKDVIGLYERMGWSVADRFVLIGKSYVTLVSPALM